MKTLALFDFDGTLTYHDSAGLFFKKIYKNPLLYLYRHYALCFPQLIKYILRPDAYLQLKNVRLKMHIGHLSDKRFNELIADFESNTIPLILKKSGLERIAWHKSQDHDIWIVSASFDFLLQKWCAGNNIGLIINKTEKRDNTCVMTCEECNFTGKVNRIKEVIDINDYSIIYAYGDSEGDKEMLKLAHHKYYKYFN